MPDKGLKLPQSARSERILVLRNIDLTEQDRDMQAICCPKCLKKYQVTDLSLLQGFACACGHRFAPSAGSGDRLAELIKRGDSDDMDEIARLLGQDEPRK